MKYEKQRIKKERIKKRSVGVKDKDWAAIQKEARKRGQTNGEYIVFCYHLANTKQVTL